MPAISLRGLPVGNRAGQVTRREALDVCGMRNPACAWPLAGKGLGCMAMTEIVLRVRLIGGEHLDVTYDEDGSTLEQIVEQVISTLAEDNGVLRCQHGDRLMVLYGRGVATVEVAPRGAVL